MKNNFPQKPFGEVIAEGGLKQKQILKLKYMFPTRDYPEGKAVISLYIPDNIQSFQVDKNLLKDYLTVEFTDLLIEIQNETEEPEKREVIARILKLIYKLKTEAKNKKNPFVVKSFRFADNDYLKSQELMEKTAKLFGFMFYKAISKTERNIETLMSARDKMAGSLSQKIARNLLDGFNEGAKLEGI